MQKAKFMRIRNTAHKKNNKKVTILVKNYEIKFFPLTCAVTILFDKIGT